MSLASHVHRALTASSSHTSLLTANARPNKREHISQHLSRNNATLSYSHDDAPSPFDMQIFDIFDAPSRLGEASRLLRRKSSSPDTSSSSSARTVYSAARSERASRVVKPLPAPIVYDGPARPMHMSATGYRGTNSHSNSRGRSERLHALPSPLPPPIMFDGPSRLRPYARSGTSSHFGAGGASSASSSQLALLAGGTGLALYAGSKYYESERQLPRESF